MQVQLQTPPPRLAVAPVWAQTLWERLFPGQVAAEVSPRVPAVSPLREPPSPEKLPEEPPPRSWGKQSVQPWLDGKVST